MKKSEKETLYHKNIIGSEQLQKIYRKPGAARQRRKVKKKNMKMFIFYRITRYFLDNFKTASRKSNGLKMYHFLGEARIESKFFLFLCNISVAKDLQVNTFQRSKFLCLLPSI